MHTCNLNYSGGLRFKQKHKTLSEKQTKSKRTGGMAQMIEGLPSKLKVLRSILSTAKRTKTTNKHQQEEKYRGCGGSLR
jgi:hypothetical protein